MKENGRKPGFAAAVRLAAPHTWPASVLPVVTGTAISCAMGYTARPWAALCCLATAVLLQAAVNTLNDYRDFASGLDSPENCPDSSDAALVYDAVPPRMALALGLGFLLAAALTGLWLVLDRGAVMLVYAAAALAAIVLYTLPGLNLSGLPAGELLSGLTMGGVLSCAAFHVQAGFFTPELIYLCLPQVLTIGCIMLVNNTADIEKDCSGGRRTLPVCIGRTGAQHLLRSTIPAALASVAIIVVLRFPRGAAVLPVMPVFMLADPCIRRLFTRPVTMENRIDCMRGILSAHVRVNSCYAAALVLHALAGAA